MCVCARACVAYRLLKELKINLTYMFLVVMLVLFFPMLEVTNLGQDLRAVAVFEPFHKFRTNLGIDVCCI
jgi:hypothetical protein